MATVVLGPWGVCEVGESNMLIYGIPSEGTYKMKSAVI